MSAENSVFSQIERSWGSNAVTVYDIQGYDHVDNLIHAKKLILKFAFQSSNADKVFLVQISEKNLLNYRLVKEMEMLELIQKKVKITDAFLYAVLDQDNCSIEDFIFKHDFLQNQKSSQSITFSHDSNLYHQNSVSRKTGAKPPAIVSKKTPVNLNKKPVQTAPQVQAPAIKANLTSKPKKAGKLGFASSNKKKDVEPIVEQPEPVKPEPVAEVQEEDEEMHFEDERKKSVEDLSQDLDEMEIRQGPRKSKKRRLVQNDSDDELEVDEPKQGLDAFYQKSSAEQSQVQNQNALKKVEIKKIKKGYKRVIKQRIKEDEKGYTVVEDYSSQEELTAEELEKQKAPPKKQVQATMPAAIEKQKTKQGILFPEKKQEAPKKQGGIMAFMNKKKK